MTGMLPNSGRGELALSEIPLRQSSVDNAWDEIYAGHQRAQRAALAAEHGKILADAEEDLNDMYRDLSRGHAVLQAPAAHQFERPEKVQVSQPSAIENQNVVGQKNQPDAFSKWQQIQMAHANPARLRSVEEWNAYQRAVVAQSAPASKKESIFARAKNGLAGFARSASEAIKSGVQSGSESLKNTYNEVSHIVNSVRTSVGDVLNTAKNFAVTKVVPAATAFSLLGQAACVDNCGSCQGGESGEGGYGAVANIGGMGMGGSNIVDEGGGSGGYRRVHAGGDIANTVGSAIPSASPSTASTVGRLGSSASNAQPAVIDKVPSSVTSHGHAKVVISPKKAPAPMPDPKVSSCSKVISPDQVDMEYNPDAATSIYDEPSNTAVKPKGSARLSGVNVHELGNGSSDANLSQRRFNSDVEAQAAVTNYTKAVIENCGTSPDGNFILPVGFRVKPPKKIYDDFLAETLARGFDDRAAGTIAHCTALNLPDSPYVRTTETYNVGIAHDPAFRGSGFSHIPGLISHQVADSNPAPIVTNSPLPTQKGVPLVLNSSGLRELHEVSRLPSSAVGKKSSNVSPGRTLSDTKKPLDAVAAVAPLIARASKLQLYLEKFPDDFEALQILRDIRGRNGLNEQLRRASVAGVPHTLHPRRESGDFQPNGFNNLTGFPYMRIKLTDPESRLTELEVRAQYFYEKKLAKYKTDLLAYNQKMVAAHTESDNTVRVYQPPAQVTMTSR